jgi:hypothetical protein
MTDQSIFGGDAKLRITIVRQPLAQQLEHFVGGLPGCADDEDEAEAIDVGLVGVGERGQHVFRRVPDSGLFARRQMMRRGEPRGQRCPIADPGMMREGLEPVIRRERPPFLTRGIQQRVAAAERTSRHHPAGPPRRSTTCGERGERVGGSGDIKPLPAFHESASG